MSCRNIDIIIDNDITTSIDIDIEKYDMREWWVASKPQHPAAEAYRSINNIYINVDIYFTLMVEETRIYSSSVFTSWRKLLGERKKGRTVPFHELISDAPENKSQD